MKEYNADFHMHSKYSGGSSDAMVLPEIARQAVLKGLDLVGTSDATNPNWLEHLEEHLTMDGDGAYAIKGYKTKFIVTTEIEDSYRVHHLILLPTIDAAKELRRKLSPHSVDIDREGRPHIQLAGEKLAEFTADVGGMLGPSHAFTPWTAVYKEYRTLAECYGGMLHHVKYLELGLSADTDMADRIGELQELTFMSNSDCHSPSPHRLGREFNRVLMKNPGFDEVRQAIERHGGRRFTLNAGLNPREGKYHLTACSRCFTKFMMTDAVNLRWRCPECGGIIKKGVADRISELASFSEVRHPKHRPPYIHSLPLAECIALVLGIKTLTSGRVQEMWHRFVEACGSEISALIDAPVEDLKAVDIGVAGVIDRFRRDRLDYVAGGGGQYGRPTLTGEKDEFYGIGQKKLGDF
ncbi:MAG: TIGR00375 family protein [Candidatus Altiarchaeota archaeon]|nr:TIGR00375 family protein [Candidatus Altiarchaeota archaeon]